MIASAAAGPDDASLVLTVRGEVTFPGAEELPDRLERALEVLPDVRAVTLDLGGVEFLDSYGLRNLVAVRRLADERGLELALEPVAPAVRRVIDATGLAALFHL